MAGWTLKDYLAIGLSRSTYYRDQRRAKPMPPKSEAQRRWAWANKDKKGKEGAAAREFAEADKGGKLPTRMKPGKGKKK
jgi:hypothetical protein